jgi:hypothetical protein
VCPLAAASPAGRRVAMATGSITTGANGSATMLPQKAAQAAGIVAFSSPGHPSQLFGMGISADMPIVIDISVAPVPAFAPVSTA